MIVKYDINLLKLAKMHKHLKVHQNINRVHHDGHNLHRVNCWNTRRYMYMCVTYTCLMTFSWFFLIFSIPGFFSSCELSSSIERIIEHDLILNLEYSKEKEGNFSEVLRSELTHQANGITN